MATQKCPRNGYSCYKAYLTLTFRTPVDLWEGLHNLAMSLTGQKTFRDYVFYPEYGANQNFHFHGVIWYSNKLHYCSWLNAWRKHVGFTNDSLKESSTDLAWHIYCRKDQYIMQHNEKPIRLHKLNIIKRLKQAAMHILCFNDVFTLTY